MDYSPYYLRLLLLSSLFVPWAEAQSKFTIDSVTLSVDPSGEIKSGTFVDMSCQVTVSHDSPVPLTHSFSLLHNDVVFRSTNTTEEAFFSQLAPARAADSGTYKCLVTVQNKSRGSIVKKLVVTGLQRPVLKVNPKMPFEGQEVTATCSASEESGSLYFYFYQGLEQIKQVRATENKVETKLEMKHAGDKHLHCVYAIFMSADTRRSNWSNVVKVTVKELFITPVMNILPRENPFEGDIVEFVCQVVSPPYPVSVFLTKGQKVLKDAFNSLSHRLRVRAEDSGEYVCKAESGNLLKEAYKSIRVKELFSKPVLVMKPREVFEGEGFTLKCYTSGHSDERINIGDVKYSLYWNQNLLTSGGDYNATAHPSLNGNYSCQAYAQGQTQKIVKTSNHIVLTAKVPLSVPRLSAVGDRLILGKPFQLQCRSENGSLPITYSLLRRHSQVGSRVVNSPREHAVFNLTSIHSITELQSFSCKAQNHPSQPPRESWGEYTRGITIIEPVSKPELSVMPTNVAEGQNLTLTCTVQRGTPPITYTWYHSKRVLPLHSISVNVMQGSYIVRSVGQEHAGKYYCVTSNPSNDIESATVTIEVKLAPWKKFLIGGFCILLIIAIILVIFIKKGLLPFQRKRAGDLSVKPASTINDETLRLTHGTANEAVNVTPGVMGRNVWSENVSGTESDDQRSEGIPEVSDIQYTDIQPQEADPSRAPVKKGTETVYSEVRNSMQGVLKSEQADSQGSVEYAQLNHTEHELEEQDPRQDQQ